MMKSIDLFIFSNMEEVDIVEGDCEESFGWY